MSVFQTPDVDVNKSLNEMEYYKWLLSNKKDNIHNIDTKIEYLSTLGFKKGVDKISEDSLRILKSVEMVYYRDLVKPIGAYEFVIDLHLKGGEVVNQYVARGGTHIEYKEPNDDVVKEKFLNRA